MPGTTDVESQYRFLISCIRHSNSGKVKEFRFFSGRLMKAHGINTSGFTDGVSGATGGIKKETPKKAEKEATSNGRKNRALTIWQPWLRNWRGLSSCKRYERLMKAHGITSGATGDIKKEMPKRAEKEAASKRDDAGSAHDESTTSDEVGSVHDDEYATIPYGFHPTAWPSHHSPEADSKKVKKEKPACKKRSPRKPTEERIQARRGTSVCGGRLEDSKRGVSFSLDERIVSQRPLPVYAPAMPKLALEPALGFRKSYDGRTKRGSGISLFPSQAVDPSKQKSSGARPGHSSSDAGDSEDQMDLDAG
ncbi:hypothetical protein GGR56DRAFT_678232 [Xylariaceae sp. FL0804]|nr:hypothetical protein GGR56DRAFT_678232 [Xylariaceae sp. FL0804]